MKKYRIINLLDRLTSNLNIEIEFGFEKELLLQAVSRIDGTIYNLNLAKELLEQLSKFKSKFNFVEEYSKCLIEVVSPPYKKSLVFNGLDELNNQHVLIDKKLKKLVKANFPEIAKQYEVRISDDGTSPSNLYLNTDLEIESDQEKPINQVIPKYKGFVRRYRNRKFNLGNLKEKTIGIYNHVNSFHITMHPTFNGKNAGERYLRALTIVNKLIRKFKKHDNGNDFVYRNKNKILFSSNLRLLFLDELIKVLNPRELSDFEIESPTIKNTANLLERLIKKSNNKIYTDKIFKSWSSLNLRPRFIDNKIPTIEIRLFGSSFSKTFQAKYLINKIIKLDNNSYL